ncbi:hypothetical protein ACFLQ8_00500 [Candidatus Auribacterota bacterium]
MKLITILLIILLLPAGPLFCEEEKKEHEFDFQKTVWGMSIEEVPKTEKELILKGDKNVQYYYAKIAGLDCLAFYSFTYGELVAGEYQVLEPFSKEEQCIESYQKLKKYLIDEYETPIEDKTIWNDDRFKDKKELWGLAVTLGMLEYYATWETDTTDIKLYMMGDENDKPKIRALYSPRKEHKKKKKITTYPYAR